MRLCAECDATTVRKNEQPRTASSASWVMLLRVSL
nr:MAG TPA: hypothetical protein [Caudoviricetes sp.]